MRKATLAIIVLFALAACGEKKQQATPAPVAAPSAEGGSVLARVGGEPVTEEEVRKVAGAKLAQAERELYDARKEGIDEIVDGRLLDAEAKKQGVSKADLLKKSVYDKIKIADNEIEKFYNENKGRMGGKKLDEVKGNIRGMLYRERQQKLYGSFVGGLRKKAKVEILITAPKVEIDEGDFPAQGPKDAPVRVIEFTDFQCPFCGKARPTVNQVMSEYKGKVRYVLRDFPLSFHKDAVKAHEAGHCADEQGKYWDYTKKIWDNQKAIGMDDLKKYAGEVKLNASKFNECLDSGKYGDKVRQSQQYGESVGVSGTPAFFVNGRMISGARPFASFKEIIDDELESAD